MSYDEIIIFFLSQKHCTNCIIIDKRIALLSKEKI